MKIKTRTPLKHWNRPPLKAKRNKQAKVGKQSGKGKKIKKAKPKKKRHLSPSDIRRKEKRVMRFGF